MKNTFYIFRMTISLLLVSAAATVFAQSPSEDSEAVFAFVQVSPSLRSQNVAPGAIFESDSKFQTANQVFQNLVRARGDLRQQVPQFVMNRRVKFVAWMDAEKVSIGLEERAFDVCKNFGADSLNALAALLAHEITHYYEKHDWTRHFATQNHGQNGLGEQLEKLDEGIKHEAQADYLGGFLAVSAGYQVLGLMPKLLDSLYSAYGLGENIAGYPSLTERKTMSETAQSLLQNLEFANQMATKLALLGEYRDAEIYLRYILKDYQSREIFNNAGVLTALAALDLTAASDNKLIFPLEIDPVSRLSGNRKGRGGDRTSLLREAENHFGKAKSLDPEYSPAWLNISCVFALQNQLDDAGYHAQKALKISKTDAEKSAAHVLLGIIAAGKNDVATALENFAKAENLGSTIGKLNRQILEKTAAATDAELPPTGNGEFGQAIEMIENLSLEHFSLKPNVENVVEIEANKVSFGYKNLEKSQIFVHLADRGKHSVIVQNTAPGYIGETEKGVVLGESKADVLAKYGVPMRTVATPTGEFFIYFSDKIGFRFGEKNTVEEWFVFRIK